jgi:uncharacterized alpha/beta hydrolase family protein
MKKNIKIGFVILVIIILTFTVFIVFGIFILGDKTKHIDKTENTNSKYSNLIFQPTIFYEGYGV